MRKRVLVSAGCLLCGFIALWWRLQVVHAQNPSTNLASDVVDVTGPVVGFARVLVGPGPQWVEPTVHPFPPLPNAVETPAQMFTSYLGDSFLSATNAGDADWVGCANSQVNNTNQVVLMWRDLQGQWYDLQGNPVAPECTNISGLWFNLIFNDAETTNTLTRELVLSGEAVW